MKADFREILTDEELRIKTCGRDDNYSDTHRYPYEPTSYDVLDRLLESGYISADDCLLDYGCGKGRVPIYLHKKLGCSTYGIELVEDFFHMAEKNVKSSSCEDKVRFVLGKAEEYQVPHEVTACFFFNPFDLGIMRGVMNRILDSYDGNPRIIRCFFYYPQDEYVAFLSTIPELDFVDEIDCMDLFEKEDRRNRIMIFDVAV